MHNALFVVSLEQDGNKLDHFFARAKAAASQGKNVEQLSEIVWLVNLETDFPVFARFLAAADALKLSYKTLLFHDEVQWLHVMADSK